MYVERFHFQFLCWLYGPERSGQPRLLDLKMRVYYSYALFRGHFGKRRIRCNSILPRFILTPHAEIMMSPSLIDMMERHTLMLRIGAPVDIAEAVVFLASDASSFITGQILSVDGGITTHQPFFAQALATNARY